MEQVLAVLNQLPEEDSPPLVKTTSLRLSILTNLAYIVGGFTFLLALLLQFVGDPLLPYVGAGVAVIVIGGIGTAWWGSWRRALVRRKVHG